MGIVWGGGGGEQKGEKGLGDKSSCMSEGDQTGGNTRERVLVLRFSWGGYFLCKKCSSLYVL